jgi:predicted amidohydrolase YtcJ
MARRLWLLLAFLPNAALAVANTLVINANVITVDKNQNHPSAQAFAFDNGRITVVGTNEEILRLRAPSTAVIDLKGRTVTAGFNDAHLHPQAIFDENPPYYRVWLVGDRVRTMSDLIAALQRKANNQAFG